MDKNNVNLTSIFEDQFYLSLQQELENLQAYLATVLNPNEYLVVQAKVQLINDLSISYAKYLEQNYSKGAEK